MNDSQDDSLDSLEIYIETIAELVEKHKKRKVVNKFQKDEVYYSIFFLKNKFTKSKIYKHFNS